MKKMKKLNIILIIVLIAFTCVTGIKAATTILASAVSYGDKTVEEALDELIEQANNSNINAQGDLYNALQYSGLVTEDMTFQEMCTVLSDTYPNLLYLYDYGNEYTEVTGGWTSYAYGHNGYGVTDNNSLGFSSFTKNDNNIYMYVMPGGDYYSRTASLIMENPIDVTNYKKIKFVIYKEAGSTYSSGNNETHFGLINSKTNNYTWVTKVSSDRYKTGNLTIELDVSDLSGLFYPCISLHSSFYQRWQKITLYSVYVDNE